MDNNQSAQLRNDFPVQSPSSLTVSELKQEVVDHPQDPLTAILEAEQKKEARLTDVRKTLQTSYQTTAQVSARYPQNPFEAA